MVLQNLFPPVWMFSLFLRCAHLTAHFTYQQNQLKNKTTMTGTVKKEKTTTASSKDGNEKEEQAYVEPGKVDAILQKITKIVLFYVLHLLAQSEKAFMRMTLRGRKETLSGTASRMSKTSIPILLGWIFMIHLVYVILLFLAGVFAMKESVERVGCLRFDFMIQYVDAGLFLILGPLFLVAIRQMKDSLYIRLELLASFVIFFVGYAVYMYLTFVAPKGSVIQKSVPPQLPLFIADSGIFLLNIYFPVFFLLVQNLTKSVKIESTPENLEKVLGDRKLMKILKDVAAKQLCLENIRFLEDMQQAKFEEVNPSYLYDKYIPQDAPFEINIPHKVRAPIKTAMADNTLTIDHFLPAEKSVKAVVLANLFAEFIERTKSV
jgi:hypothetical protein